MFFVSLIKGLAQGYFFRYLSRFLNPELLVGIVFIINLIIYLSFPNKISITTGDSLMLEFVILHANFISIIAALSSPNQEVYKNRQTAVNLFYLVFIVLIAIGLNAWFFMLNYFWLLYHRFTISFNESLKKRINSCWDIYTHQNFFISNYRCVSWNYKPNTFGRRPLYFVVVGNIFLQYTLFIYPLF